MWEGRPALTDTSDLTRARLEGIEVEKRVSTTVIQGDRDTQGTLFSQLTTAFR